MAAAFGRPDEAMLVDALRDDGDCAISLVCDDGEIVGHVLLSPMSAPFRALGLAPVSVRPDRQNQGIGGRLIRAALRQAAEARWEAVFVLGDPAYYGRFGFDAKAAAGFTSPFAGPCLQVCPLTGALPRHIGRVDYARAFTGLS